MCVREKRRKTDAVMRSPPAPTIAMTPRGHSSADPTTYPPARITSPVTTATNDLRSVTAEAATDLQSHVKERFVVRQYTAMSTSVVIAIAQTDAARRCDS